MTRMPRKGRDEGAEEAARVPCNYAIAWQNCMVVPELRVQGSGRLRGGSYLEAEAVPMAAPFTTSSTRRLRWRPSAVSLEATGWVLPKPWAVMEEAETPCSARKSRT